MRGETFFSPLLRFWARMKNVLMALEYLYETSLIPKQQSDRYSLKWDKKVFLRTFKITFKTLITKKIPYIDIVSPEIKIKSNKPRVVHLIVWLGGIGGAPRLILDIVNGLKEKYKFEGITLSDDFPFKYSHFTVKHFSNPRETLNYLLSNPPAILHTYYYGDWERFHQYFEAILDSKLKSAIIENLLVPIHIYRSPRIDWYVFCSKYIQQIQYKKYPNETVVYPGVDTEEFKPNNLLKRPDSVGMVYRLWDDKIDQSTIEMFIVLAKKRPKTLIYIVGGGFNFHHYVERTRQEGVRGNFYFTGEVGYKDLHSWYDKFGIFIAPVHNESYGLVVPYAMSKRIPVIAYRRGVLPELLGDTNRLVNTSPEMVQAIIDLLDNQEKIGILTKNSRERVIKNFSMNRMITDYDNLYTNLMNKKQNNVY